MTPDRHIPLDGATNFRDFGGYAAADGRRVKWRRLYRSDRLSGLTDADVTALASHGVRWVYDLRRPSEREAAPTRWPGLGAPELISAPLFEDAVTPSTLQRMAANPNARHDGDLAREFMRRTYQLMARDAGPLTAYGRIFARLAEPEAFPALFHCSAGKDRTGVVCALILLVLGVAREDVVADYMLTARYYNSAASRAARISQVLAGSEMGFWSEAALVPIFTVEQGYIETALDLIEADGGAETFLATRSGVAPEAFDKMRAALLE